MYQATLLVPVTVVKEPRLFIFPRMGTNPRQSLGVTGDYNETTGDLTVRTKDFQVVLNIGALAMAVVGIPCSIVNPPEKGKG